MKGKDAAQLLTNIREKMHIFLEIKFLHIDIIQNKVHPKKRIYP